MLDIPELDDMIIRQLSKRDLLQCAQVCKRWHSTIVPYLWRDLKGLESRYKGRQYFRIMVQEDYLFEQRYQQLRQEGSETGRAPKIPLSPLIKYGQLIRLLPNLHDLYKVVMPVHTMAQYEGPKPIQLLLHLLRRCSPVVQVDSAIMYTHNLDPDPRSIGRAIMNFTLPRVRHLLIRLRHPLPHSEVSKLRDMLDQCSHPLQRLALNVIISSDSGMGDFKEVPTENESKSWASLKDLTFHEWRDDTDTKMFWPWFFRKCGQVEKLGVLNVHGAAQHLKQAMSMHMPQLTEIDLGVSRHKCVPIPDNEVATLLSGSTKGWKRVTLGESATFGRATMKALAEHFSTLETLGLCGFSGHSSNDVIQILRSCTQLRSLTIIDSLFKLDTKVFVDQDPVTGVLRPWQCERTLKVLNVQIDGIPEPSLQEKEAYTGQGYKMEDQLYDRLARLTNLETLRLEDRSYEHDGHLWMSLRSGLHKLSGLRSLRELRIEGLSRAIYYVKER